MRVLSLLRRLGCNRPRSKLNLPLRLAFFPYGRGLPILPAENGTSSADNAHFSLDYIGRSNILCELDRRGRQNSLR